MFTFSVVVGTYGGAEWIEKAERALASVENQTVAAASVHHIHGETLAQARNEGAWAAEGSYLIFLDADDELDERYIEAMTGAVEDSQIRSDAKTFLYQPSTLGIVDGVEDAESVLIPQRPLDKGNFMVIGTAVERQLCVSVGGFDEWPMFEDWAFFIKCQQAGAGFCPVPEAVYRVHVNPDGRNSADRATSVHWFNEIRNTYFLKGN